MQAVRAARSHQRDNQVKKKDLEIGFRVKSLCKVQITAVNNLQNNQENKNGEPNQESMDI